MKSVFLNSEWFRLRNWQLSFSCLLISYANLQVASACSMPIIFFYKKESIQWYSFLSIVLLRFALAVLSSYELCLVSLLEIIRKMESIFNLTIIPHKPIFQMHSTKSNIIPPPFNVISIHNTSAKSRSATTKAQHYAITSVVQTPSCHYHNLYGKEKIMGKGTKWRGSARMNGPRVMKCDSPNDVWHIRDPRCGDTRVERWENFRKGIL